MFNELVDIKEDNLLQANNEILSTLLFDNTTKKILYGLLIIMKDMEKDLLFFKK